MPFKQRASGPLTIEYRIGERNEIRNMDAAGCNGGEKVSRHSPQTIMDESAALNARNAEGWERIRKLP